MLTLKDFKKNYLEKLMYYFNNKGEACIFNFLDFPKVRQNSLNKNLFLITQKNVDIGCIKNFYKSKVNFYLDINYDEKENCLEIEAFFESNDKKFNTLDLSAEWYKMDLKTKKIKKIDPLF